MISEQEKNVLNNAVITELLRNVVTTSSAAGSQIAVKYANNTITYAELNGKSNALARVLLDRGVQKGKFVSICMPKSIEAVISMIAVLKTGAAYVPIDPKWPTVRLSEIFDEISCSVILVTEKTPYLVSLKYQSITVNYSELPVSDADVIPDVENTAPMYVLFTSGSTGKPKGVIVPYRGVLNRFDWMNRQFGEGLSKAVIQLSKYTFDVSIGQIFWPLMNGGMTIVPDFEVPTSEDVGHLIHDNKVEVISFVPSILKEMLSSLEEDPSLVKLWSSLKHVWLGGEQPDMQDVRRLYALLPNVTVSNHYGPTETTIACLYHEIERDEMGIVPIGKPISNVKAFLLDENKALVPQGEEGKEGEIYIAGVGLAAGYLNEDRKTSEVFLEIFIDSHEYRVYKTGDIGKYVSEDRMVYLGRKDEQVKINGQRIELQEIAYKMNQIDAVRSSVVVVKNYKNTRILAAYYCSDKEIPSDSFVNSLRDELPDFMLPSVFIRMPVMPLNSNGKVERNRLPDPYVERSEGAYPATETEVKLLNLWNEIMPNTFAFVTDDFFTLGGNSLKAANLVAGIERCFHVKLTLSFVFYQRTVRMQADYINKLYTGPLHKGNVRTVIQLKDNKATSNQLRLHTIQQLVEQNTAYNIPGILQIEGELEIPKLRHAIMLLTEHHSSLRSAFNQDNGELQQIVFDRVELPFEVEILNGRKVEHIFDSFIRPFCLDEAPLYRIKVIKETDSNWILLFDFHHIVADGLSVALFLNQLFDLYDGNTIAIPRRTFLDFTRTITSPEQLEQSRRFWKSKYSDSVPVLNIPLDYPRPSVQTLSGNNVTYLLDDEMVRKLHETCAKRNLTLFTLLLSAYYILLAKYSSQTEIVVGTAVNGRDQDDLDKLMGMFVNTLPIKCTVDPKHVIDAFLEGVRYETLQAFDHPYITLETLIEDLRIVRDPSRNPLFEAFFVLQNMEQNELMVVSQNRHLKQYTKGNLLFRSVPFRHQVAKFDLLLEVVQNEQGIFLNFEHNTNLFKEETVRRWLSSYCKIIECIVDTPQLTINQIELIDQEDEKLYDLVNDTEISLRENASLACIFEEQAAHIPDHIAIQYGRHSLTYEELNRRANKIAHYLISRGVGRDSLVPIITYRSLEMMVGILGILKAGGAYIPIDPDMPESRKTYILRDCNANLVLVQAREYLETGGSIEQIVIGDYDQLSSNISNPVREYDPDSLAYIIYTSGTTGHPKGVMIEHRSVINRIDWMQRQYQATCEDVILQKTPYIFDVSVWELFWWFFVGAKVVFLEPGWEKEPALIISTIKRERISLIHFVPSMLEIFLGQYDSQGDGQLDSLRYVFASGEALKRQQVLQFRELFASRTALINLYGPTEATVDVTSFNCSDAFEGSVPIGKPIDNTKVYIVDPFGNRLPIGVPGELWISGVGVARGYLNNRKLTNDKFISDPYVSGMRLYKTGDICRLLPDGNIEYLGRSDEQVKIRGYRIELSEVQQAFSEIEGIKTAIVICKELNKEQVICGYYIPAKEITSDEIKQQLTKRLPYYMVPSYFLPITEVPLTTNGKLNKSKLPNPVNAEAVPLCEPENEVQREMLEIFRKVLSKTSLGIDSNFFEHGGHSLKAAECIYLVNKRWNRHLSLGVLFKYPTVAELSAQYVMKELTSHRQEPTGSEAYRGIVTSAQRRLYVLEKFDRLLNSYHMPGFFTVDLKIDSNRLKVALQALIYRQEALRTSFHYRDGQVIQQINDNVIPDFSVISVEQGFSFEAIMDSFLRPFNLETAPLLRVGLVVLDNNTSIVMFDIHHIISDGASVNRFLYELISLYNGEALESVPPFSRYANAQHDLLLSDISRTYEKRWLQMLDKAEDSPLKLPHSFSRPAIQSHEGDYLVVNASQGLHAAIQNFARSHDCTVNMVMLAAYFILLSRYTDQEDLIVGTPISGRTLEYKDCIGMFVDTMPVRSKVNSRSTIIDYVQDVKATLLQVIEMSNYPLERLIEILDVRRDTSRTPLFDTMLVFNRQDESGLPTIDNHEIQLQPYYTKTAKFDLTVEVAFSTTELLIRFEYCTKLFERSRVEQFAAHYLELLKSVCASSPTARISQIDFLTKEEIWLLTEGNNDTVLEYDANLTILDLFDQRIRIAPYDIAVQFEDQSLTYMELEEKSNRLASLLLRKYAVNRHMTVGIMMERSHMMLVALMGVMKTGAAYVPIDTSFPDARIAHILENSQSCAIVTDKSISYASPQAGCDIVYLEDAIECENMDRAKRGKNIEPEDLMYVIYTSGSTGIPKGVSVTHRNVMNFLAAMDQVYRFRSTDAFLSVTTISFDISVLELFWTLVNGVKIIIHSEKSGKLGLNRYEHEVSLIQSTPTRMRAILDDPNSRKLIAGLNAIFIGGEPFPVSLANDLRNASQAKLFNMYGPTETTVWSSYYEVNESFADRIPIGKPLANTQIYILDQNRQLVPSNVVGEIWIGGDGVTKGYWRNTELTYKMFSEVSINGQTNWLYRTGDLGRWQNDGTLDCLGRADQQIKLRGYRIELGEIETAILSHPAVSETVVIMTKDQVLAAYVVWHFELDASDLRHHLSQTLPAYMIPVFFVKMRELPLTPNGKIDRRSLPVPDRALQEAIVEPTNETERILLDIWQGLFQIDELSILNDFFDLGGHSLLAIKLEIELEKFGFDASLVNIMHDRTIKDMAKRLR